MPRSRLSPHDRFVRSLMTNPRVIREFLEQHLPDRIRDILDFSSIEPQKESFVDDSLRLQIADLLYAVKFNGNAGFLYILIEHQSTASEMLPLRILKYMLKVIDYHLQKTGSKQLPLVYPCIIYSGEKPYTYSMDLFDLFGEQKALAKEMMMSPYHLVDLTQASEEELKQFRWFGTLGLLAKHIHDPDILPFFKSFLDVLRKLESEGESRYIYTVISYIVEAGEVSDKAEFLQTIKQLESVSEEKIMTLVEQLKPEIYKRGIEKGMQQGIEKGIERGIEKASYKIAFNFLKLGLSLEQISQATGLSLSELKDLKKQIH